MKAVKKNKRTIPIPSKYKRDLQKRKGLESMKHKILCTIKSTTYYANVKGLFLNRQIQIGFLAAGVGFYLS